jgi:hypothetical protein
MTGATDLPDLTSALGGKNEGNSHPLIEPHANQKLENGKTDNPGQATSKQSNGKRNGGSDVKT